MVCRRTRSWAVGCGLKCIDSGPGIFVGIARADDVDEYLQGVERATLDEISDPATRYIDHSGGAPMSPPGDLDIWVAQSSGTGSRVVDWSVEPGRWTVVVMNEDGTAGVDVDADVGSSCPGRERSQQR